MALGRALTAAGRLESARTQLDLRLQFCGAARGGRAGIRLIVTAPVKQAAGDLAGALALVDEAETLLVSFDDAGILASLLHDVQRRISLSRQRRRDGGSTALTETELAVLQLLRTPRSQRAIADELSISINTVKTHTTRSTEAAREDGRTPSRGPAS